MNVLLVQAPMPSNLMMKEILDFGLKYMPLQLGYMAAVLRQYGHNVEIADLHVQRLTPEDYAREYLKAGVPYDMVGISCTTVSYNQALRIAELTKLACQGVKITLGGPHVTFRAKEALERSRAVDYVVRGEGERTLLELVEALAHGLSLENVLGLTYREGAAILENHDRPPLADLDTLPFPARDLLVSSFYPNEGIVTSRGCPRRCIFCAAGAMSNYSYRIRSPRSIVEELRLLQGERVISFYDNTFSGHYETALQICEAIISAKLNISWTCELRVDRATPELFAKLRAAGCRGVQFGVESGSDEVLRAIKKGITVSQVRSAVEMAMAQDLKVVCSFTLGHPLDTPETIDATFSLMKELKRIGATVSSALLVPYPGTDLCERSNELGITIHDENWDTYYPARPIISTKYLSRDRLGEYYMYSKLTLEDPHFVNLRLALEDDSDAVL
ncbi:MAG: B12-binding domain-containing radical SAM protein [Betaproteobacteria bacterium]